MAAIWARCSASARVSATCRMKIEMPKKIAGTRIPKICSCASSFSSVHAAKGLDRHFAHLVALGQAARRTRPAPRQSWRT
jgi:hypothetical protein